DCRPSLVALIALLFESWEDASDFLLDGHERSVRRLEVAGHVDPAIPLPHVPRQDDAREFTLEIYDQRGQYSLVAELKPPKLPRHERHLWVSGVGTKRAESDP